MELGQKGASLVKAGTLVILLLLAGNSAFAETRVSVGVQIGGGHGYGYYPAPPVVVYRPPCPYPGYTWVPGYWYGVGPRHSWRAGYWAPPRYRSGFYGHSGYYGRFDRRDHDRRSWGDHGGRSWGDRGGRSWGDHGGFLGRSRTPVRAREAGRKTSPPLSTARQNLLNEGRKLAGCFRPLFLWLASFLLRRRARLGGGWDGNNRN